MCVGVCVYAGVCVRVSRINYSQYILYIQNSPPQNVNFIPCRAHPNIFEFANREILEINDDVEEGASDASRCTTTSERKRRNDCAKHPDDIARPAKLIAKTRSYDLTIIQRVILPLAKEVCQRGRQLAVEREINPGVDAAREAI